MSLNDWSSYKNILPNEIINELQSGAYDSYCSHLRERSESVSNMDLMTLSGACRNCLAKWLVLEARTISDRLKKESKNEEICRALDSFSYDDGAKIVYGCAYPDWKKRYQKKATEEQLKAFDESKPLWAKHDKEILKPRVVTKSEDISEPVKIPESQSNLQQSNVCCQDVDNPTTPKASVTPTPQLRNKPANLRVAILTVSDRASSNEYKTGDLSGPAVESSLSSVLKSINTKNSTSHTCNILFKEIVPDDLDEISNKLSSWSNDSDVNLILTSGGTGFSPRDVTPEATKRVIEQDCSSLLSYISTECAVFGKQPYAALSRGAAGIIKTKVFVANLPGNPRGILQIMELFLPLLCEIVIDLDD